MEKLAARGFEMLDTTKLDLQQQIDTFAQAKMIIAPTGAALTNLLWCQPGTKTLVLVADNPQGNHNIFTQLAEPLGQDLYICLGTRMFNKSGLQAVHDDYETDIDAIMRWCDRFEDAKIEVPA